MSQPPEEFSRVLASWRPAPETVTDDLVRFPAAALAALLGSPEPGADFALPPLWSEVYLRSARPVSALGPDGHPANDRLVPPLTERRRMFGGGRIQTAEPLRVGERATRRTSITDVRLREGRSGWLLLVTEMHEYLVGDVVRVHEERDVVYRRAEDVAQRPRPTSASALEPPTGTPAYRLEPDERLLFCFSALTYNAHRIHYDRRYAVDVEGHRDLLVHGPLTVIGAVEAVIRATGGRPRDLDYRLLFPAFPGSPIDFHVGQGADEARVLGTQNGVVVVEARMTWA
ncbi:MAG: FAS1-like dehydratase domain-containing protein [Nocardioides sp.]